MKSLLISVFILFSLSLNAADYYLSNAGNDANNGTSSATPWRTLTKLSAELGGTSGTWGTISTGDRVFFRKGDVFRGSIAFSAYNNDGITFNSYGTGAMPIIKGSTLVTTWTVHSGSIWKATLAQRPYFLYANTSLKTLARAPNTGTWNLSAATGTSLTSTAVGSSGLNFVGANVCIREYDWQLNRQVVTTQASNTVNWATSINAAAANANFYFDNKLSLLDTEGEWFWDSATNTLYYMSATDPNTLTMEASTNLLGVAGNDNRSNNVFQNLQFAHFAQEGIRLMGSANGNTIQNCIFNDINQAVFVSGSTNTIQNNTISNCYYQGAVLANMASSTFSNNTITNVGLTFGQHRPDFTGSFYSGGVWLINGNSGGVISSNVISNIGNIGIRFNGTGIIVERNQVTNAMTNMDDGGGIYTWGGNNSSYGNTIRNNIVDNLVGSYNGTAVGHIINGIYIDNDAYNITVQNNTVKNILDGSGMIVNAGAYGCTVSGNVTYKCKQGLGFFDWRTGQSIYNNTATGNTFYANLVGAFPIQIASDDNNYTTMTSCNNNFLCNPYSSNVVSYLWSGARTFTLAQWRTATGFDAASVGTYYTWTSPTDNSFLVTNNTASAVVYNYTNVKNLNNQAVSSITLQPFTSQVLINTPVLSVEWLKFEGYTEGPSNHLVWQTGAEINNKGFNIERLTHNGQWITLGFVNAACDGGRDKGCLISTATTATTTYNFIDNQPLATSYYRLRQMDNDGKETLSKVVSIVNTHGHVYLRAYPSVTTDILTIETSETTSIQVFNLLGQPVLIGKMPPSRVGGLDVSALPQGTYILKVGTQQIKFIKQ